MQKLINTFKPRLSGLVKQFPCLSTSFGDDALALNGSNVLKKLGFGTNSNPKQDTIKLVKNLEHWLKNDNLVLLQYTPKSGDRPLIKLLRAVKDSASGISFKNLIPVLITSYSSRRQVETFRLLSAFDIQYVSFLTPDAAAQKNVEEILVDLVNFRQMLKKGLSGNIKEPGSDANLDKIEKYKDLVSRGKKFMQNSKYEEAIELLTEAIELNPDFEALIDRGDAYYKSTKYMPALLDYREANKLQQSTPEPYIKIGACCLTLIKENMKNKNPEKAKQFFTLGMKHFKIAENMASEMIRKNQDAPERIPEAPYAAIVSALADADIRGLGMDDMETQITKFTAGVVEKTRTVDYLSSSIDIDARLDQAILLSRTKNYEKAEKIFRQIINDDPSLVVPAFNNFAVELRKNGREEKAFEIYKELLEHEISDRDIIIENLKTAGLQYAANLRNESKHKEAIFVYKTILSADPRGHEWVLCELAMAFLEIQGQAQASSRLMEAVYINPKLMTLKEFEPFTDLLSLKEEMIKKLSGRNL